MSIVLHHSAGNFRFGRASPALYWLKENHWLLRTNHDGAPRRWRGGRTVRTRGLPRNSLPARWRLSCRRLGWQCLPESGQESLLTTLPISTITFTARKKISEARLRGHTLLGCGASPTRSIPHPSSPRSRGAWRNSPRHDGRGVDRTSGRPGSARSSSAGGGRSRSSQNPRRSARGGSSAVSGILSGRLAFV